MDVEGIQGKKLFLVPTDQPRSSHYPQTQNEFNNRLYFSFGNNYPPSQIRQSAENEIGQVVFTQEDSTRRRNSIFQIENPPERYNYHNRDAQRLNSSTFKLERRDKIESRGDFDIYSSTAINKFKTDTQGFQSPSIRQLGMGFQGFLDPNRVLTDKITERNEEGDSQNSIMHKSSQNSKDQSYRCNQEKYIINIQDEEEKNQITGVQIVEQQLNDEEIFNMQRTSSLSKYNNKVQLKDLQKFCSQEILLSSQFLAPHQQPRLSLVSSQKIENSALQKQFSGNPIVSNSRRNSYFDQVQKSLKINSNLSEIFDSHRSSSALSSSPSFTMHFQAQDQVENLFLMRQQSVLLGNYNYPRKHKKENKQDRVKFKKDEIATMSITINIIGFLNMIGLICLIAVMRNIYLNSIYFYQFSIFALVYSAANQIVLEEKPKYLIFILFASIMQHPQDSQVCLTHKITHIILNLWFLVYFCSIQQHDHFKQISMTKKINQIIQSDNHLKNLVQLIPYGIGVLNLDDVSHFNNPFGKVLGIEKPKEVLLALTKFQRKIKLEDKSHIDKGKDSQTVKYSNLKDDLRFILDNKELAFSETNNIFDIYYIEKDDRVSLSKINSSLNKDSTASVNQGTKNQSYDSHSSQVVQARKFYSISISPINWKEKECLLLTVKDITHEKIVDQKKVLERLKNMIFKSFSHELKTPLNGIIMSLETSHYISKKIQKILERERNRGQVLLQESVVSSKQLRKQLKIIESCAFVLKNIMHDFFDYNQLQSNELQLNIKEFDLQECIKHIQKIIQHQIQFDKIQFKCKIEYQNPNGFSLNDQKTGKIKMVTDKDRLQQILFNLLMNAIKFTNKGLIELEVFVKQLSIKQCVKFKVKDTGIGIEESRLPYIFNLFEKNENSNIQNYLNTKKKSARMGLPISQNLCQLMGGHIFVKSKVNQGTTFSFALPLKLDDPNSSKTIDNSLNTNMLIPFYDNSSLTRRTIEVALATPSEAPSRFKFSNEESKTELDGILSYDQKRDYEDKMLLTKRNSIIKDQVQKSSSKEFFINKSQKIGGFEIVFKSPNSKDKNFFKFYINPNQEFDDNDQAATPKLTHSNTIVEGVVKLNSDQLPKSSYLRKMKTSQAHVPLFMEPTDEQSLSADKKLPRDSQNSLAVHKDTEKKESYLAPEEFNYNNSNSNFSFQNFLNSNKKGINALFVKDAIQNSNSNSQRQVKTPLDWSPDLLISSKDQDLANESIESVSLHSVDKDRIFANDQEEELYFRQLQLEKIKKDKLALRQRKMNYATLIMQRSKEYIKSSSFIKELDQHLMCEENSNKSEEDVDAYDLKLRITEEDDCLIDSERPRNINYDDTYALEINPGRELFEQSQTLQSLHATFQRHQHSMPLQNNNITLPINHHQHSLPIQDHQTPLLTQQSKAQDILSPYNQAHIQRSKSFKNAHSQPSKQMLSASREKRMQDIRNDLRFTLNQQPSLYQPQFHEASSPNLSQFTISMQQQQVELPLGKLPIFQDDSEHENDYLRLNPAEPTFFIVNRKHTQISFQDKVDTQNSVSGQLFNKANHGNPHKDSWQNVENQQIEEEVKLNEDSMSEVPKNSRNNVFSSNSRIKSVQAKKKAEVFKYWPVTNSVASDHNSFTSPNMSQGFHSYEAQALSKMLITHSEDRSEEYFQSPHLGRTGTAQPQPQTTILTRLSGGLVLSEQQEVHQCPKVMVVDDVQMNRYVIEQMLSLIYSIKVLQAENGQDCLEVLQKFYQTKNCSCEGIKLILMDLEMPVMDGLTCTRKLRQIMSQGTVPDIPIVALTAFHDERQNCLQAGMKDFMVKPTNKSTLEEMLYKFRVFDTQ